MKHIALFFDGTWNKADQKDRGKRKPSNVVKLSRAVLPKTTKGITQITFYDEGVGTGAFLDKIFGGAFGKGLSKNIIDGYTFLSNNYSPGDKVFIYGFSRGAYTARSLTGLLDLVGVLHKKDAFFTPDFYDIYRRQNISNEERVNLIKEFKDRYTKASGKEKKNIDTYKVGIELLGVWDTVGSLGIPSSIFSHWINKKYQFHNVALSSNVSSAYHALGIDEKRKNFKPTLWVGKSSDKQIFEQRWFCGVHTNIGGGYDNDGLANIPLHWIKRKSIEAGLEVDDNFIKHYREFFCDELRNSYKGFYKLLGINIRTINNLRNGNQKIDSSVFKRIEEDNCPSENGILKYNPMNIGTE